MHPITEQLKLHYAQSFRDHGATAKGVDWRAEADLEMRYRKMLDVILAAPTTSAPTLLDVGCGFGGLLNYAEDHGVAIEYTGIDVVSEMIEHAREVRPAAAFFCEDVFAWGDERQYDYVVCNGILTQKLTASIREMDRYAQSLVRRMFDLASVGIVFNVMTTKVDYTKENLYHRSPAEMLAWCLAEITGKVRIDHAYPLFEYCVYLYRDDGRRGRSGD
jgi:2-polyprenyl-3-methyl-5-hydroxy-6-metoxy-1,4-benzoquinol methylase